jgi:hypothetical protein
MSARDPVTCHPIGFIKPPTLRHADPERGHANRCEALPLRYGQVDGASTMNYEKLAAACALAVALAACSAPPKASGIGVDMSRATACRNACESIPVKASDSGNPPQSCNECDCDRLAGKPAICIATRATAP